MWQNKHSYVCGVRIISVCKKIKYNWYNNNDNPMGKEAKRTVCIWTFLPNKYIQGTYNYHDWKCLLPCLYKTQTPDLTKLATCNKILT